MHSCYIISMEKAIYSGLIIKTTRVKEADVRLALLTPDGKRVAVAVGLVRPSAKLKGVLQLFNQVEIETMGTRVTGASIIKDNTALAKDYERYVLACGICEALDKLSVISCQSEESQTIYSLVLSAFEALHSPEIEVQKIFIAFYLRLLQAMGYDSEASVGALRMAYKECLDYELP